MAIDFDEPTTATSYLTVLSQIIENLDAVMLQNFKSGSNIPNGAIIIDPTDKDFEKYDSSGPSWDKYDVKANAKELLGVALDDTGLASGDLYQYDGTDFVAVSLADIIGSMSDWSPTFGGANGLTLSAGSSTTEGKYLTLGPITFAFWIGTIRVNSAGGSATLSLPVSKVSPNQQILGVGFRYTGGVSTYEHLICQMSSNTAYLQWEDSQNWTASTDHSVSVAFAWRTT